MASRDFLKHVVSTTEPTGSTLGDEWYNPSTNILSKRLVVNGTTVRFVQLGGGLTVQQSGTTIVSNTSALNFPGASVAHNTITGVTDILASGTPGGSNTQIQFNNAGAFGGSSNLVWNNGTQTLTVTGFFAANQVRATGGLNASAWTTTGPIFNTSGTLTDVSGSGGTVALRTSTSFNSNIWTASVATTVTDAATLYIDGPTAGSNTSITNRYSIYATENIRAPGFVAGDSRVVDWKNTTAQWSLSGGGLVTWNGSSILWSSRVIAIPVERGEMGSDGYFDISCPTTGAVSYYNSVGGLATLSCTAAGIPLAAWEALYYEVAEGMAATSSQARFRVVNYQNSNWRPGPGWILICAVNGDGTNVGHVKWLPGQINLPTTGATVTYNTGTGISSWAVGTGTVTSVSVVGANGFGGTVANASSTPAISLSTSVTGILYGNGTGVSAAVAGNFPTLNQNTTGSASYVSASDDRIKSPNDDLAGNVRFGFTSFANNNSAPYADYFHLRSYSDSSGGNDNLVMFRKDAIGIRVWQQAWGSSTAYATFKDVAFTDTAFNLGTTSIALNRASAAQSLTGINIDGSAGTFTSTSQNSQFNSVGIGVGASASAGSLIHSVAALGGTAGNLSTTLVSYRGTVSNASLLDINIVRDSNGSDWTTAGTRIQQKIDSTWMAYQQFNGTSVQGGIEWGSGTTTTSATSISARMRLDSSGILRLLTNASSSSTTTGTLVVTGGTGISENLYVGGYSQHAGGLVRANSRFTSSERYPVGHYTSGETVFEIDPTMTQAELQAFFNTSSVSWNNDTTAPGYCIQIDGNPSFAAVAYGSGFPLIPVETDDIFYMEVWLRNDPTYTGAGHYMGSVDISASGASLGGNPGSFGYWVMSNTPGSTTWTRYSGYITGFGTAVGQFVANTKYWTPQMLANYSYSGGTRRSFISGWKVIRVTGRGNRKFAGHVAFSVNSAVSAAGSTQGTATTITTDVVNVTGGSGGVILPYWQPGHRIVVRNALGSAINVYPNSGAQINTAGTNVAVSVLAGSTIEFINISSTQWAIVNAVYA